MASSSFWLSAVASASGRPPFTDYVGTRWYRAPECLLRDRGYSSPVASCLHEDSITLLPATITALEGSNEQQPELVRTCNCFAEDVWSSGLVFAELLRGSPVFMGSSSMDQLYKIFSVIRLHWKLESI